MAATMSMSQNLGDTPALGTLLQCTICMDDYHQPKLLPCGHTFCLRCVEGLLQSSHYRAIRNITCPVCRKDCRIPGTGPHMLQDDFRVEQIRDAFMSISMTGQSTSSEHCDVCRALEKQTMGQYSCINCHKTMCEDCLETHNNVSNFSAHTVIRKDDQFGQVICKEHEENCAYVCTECSKLVCVTCLMTSCALHNCNDILTVAQQRKAEVLKATKNMDKKLDQAQRCLDKHCLLYENRAKMFENVEQGIQEQTERLLTSIRENSENMMSQLVTIKTEMLGKIESSKIKTEEHLRILKALYNMTTNASETGMEPQMLALLPSLKAMLSKTAYRASLPVTPKYSFRAEDQLCIGSLVLERDTAWVLEPTKRRIEATMRTRSPSRVKTAKGTGGEESEGTPLGSVESDLGMEEQEESIWRSMSLWKCGGLGDGWDVSVFGGERIALSDRKNQRVTLYDRNGNGRRYLADSRIRKVQLNKPSSLAYDTVRNELLVSDPDQGAILYLDPATLLEVSRMQCASISEPHGLAILSNGNVVVTEAGQRRHGVSVHDNRGACIVKWGARGTRDSTVPRSWWGQRSTEPLFSYPLYTAVDKHDRILVADLSNNQIQVFAPNGRFLKRFGDTSDMELPRGIAIDDRNHILVAQSSGGHSKLTRYSPDGRLVSVIMEWEDAQDGSSIGALRSVALDGGTVAVIGSKGLEVHACSY